MPDINEEGPYIIEHGDVWRLQAGSTPFHRNNKLDRTHVCRGSELLAVAFNAEDGTLHKVGSAEGVEKWVDATRNKFVQGGFPELAEELVLISFPVAPETVAEINACIAISGRVVKLQERLEAMAEANPALLNIPQYPRH